ncbi:hypothetical protein ABWH91_08220 [Phycisphaerales bacterium ac7]
MSKVLGSLRESQCRRANRVALIGIVAVMVLFGSVLVRVIQLQVAPSTELAEFIQQRQSRALHSAPRGDLLDRRGRVLAATRPGYRVFVDPYALADLDLPPSKRATAEELQARYSQTIEDLCASPGFRRVRSPIACWSASPRTGTVCSKTVVRSGTSRSG